LSFIDVAVARMICRLFDERREEARVAARAYLLLTTER